MEGTMIVFDFDKTIIDCDSDNLVIDHFGGTERFDELLLTFPWNTAMDKIMGEFHEQGKSIEAIKEILIKAPLSPHTISAIKSAYSLGCELRIVSDANIFFIETILKHHGLMNYFSEINTNSSYVDNEGRLRISPYHDFTISSHGCSLGTCPPNMCKGLIIERIKKSMYKEGKQRLIYLGDGKGDYCPLLKLSERDQMMPRRNYPVWDLICSKQNDINAQMYDWADAEELERVLLRLVNGNSSSVQLISADATCHAAVPVTSHEALPKVLNVSN
ncbi:inorganic pyrophosphatase 1-like [Carex rostrata]